LIERAYVIELEKKFLQNQNDLAGLILSKLKNFEFKS